MKKQCLIYVAVLSLLCVLGCKEGKKNILEYSKYISGFTQGMIRSTDPIYIRLESAALKFNDSLPVPVESLFKIAPDVSGTLTFRGGVVEFHPSERLKNDHTYQVSLRLDPICDVPDNLKTFQFQIKTIPQTFAFQEGGLDIEEGEEKLFRYRGTIVNADLLENQEEVEKLVKASFDKASPDVEWEHLTPYAHLFTVHRLKRGTETKILTLTFNQKVKNGNDLLVEIPGENTFSVLEIRPGDSESRSIQIVMSDNLDASQNLQGLIGVEEVKNMKYDIEGNIVRVYTDEQEKLQGVVQVTVHQGIRSKIGDKLPADITLPLSFPSVNPRVDLFMNAPITPSEGDAIIPFTAVGLKAVQLRVVKLFAQNMNFYLQMSDYDKENTGSRHEFSRVARLVLNKKINLVKEGELFDPDVWQDYTINLADHLTLEKGVIYRLELRFQRSYTGMPCARNQEDKLLTEDNWDNPQRDDYEYYDDDDGDYYYSYPSDFVWEERNDPCSNSYYYMRDRFPHRNIIVTSLGLLAKAGIDGKYAVAVTDLLTAAPVENCTLYFYNYQNQKIDSARTNAAGIATARPPGKPFVIVAQKGNDKVHLKVSDNTALSFSNFDVSGAVIQQGLKGFIYGERDVWRPGNDIYLSFMLEDKENLIPAGHPIIAELYDPSGNIVQVKRETRNEHGLYCFPLKTDADAVTGYWRAVVKVGGAHFTKTVRVETIKPNRLTINVQLPAPVLGEGVAATRVPVQTRWMHGAKTSNLETNTVLRLSHARTTFPNFGDYTFDLARYFEATETTIFDGKTDADGNFTIPLADIDASSPPGMLNALLTTQVFENGGDFSIVTTAFKYSPYKEYVGIKLPEAGENGYTPGSSIAVQGVTVQPDGKQAGNSEIELEVYSVNWRWWWDSDNDELGSYIARSYNKPVYTTTVRAANGKFSASVSCAKFGRYYILAHDKASGHSTGATFHVYNRGAADLPGAATLLGLSSNKKAYTVGDKIEITFPSSAGSTAIVSIENGKTVKEITRVVATAGTTTFTTTATEEMCPNAYINITLVQPHLNRTNDKTIRLYGVLNIPVEAPALRLQPRVDMPDELRPSSDFTLAVTETDGKPMTYTIAIVDEGLLALTSFRTPDPFPAFYAREALGVKTWDFYDQVAGAHGARVAKAFAIGGDEAIVDDGKRKSDRFTPVVIFRGPFTLRPGGRDTHNFTMPEYIGETRVMIIAEDNGRYGSVAKSVKVNNPLMLNVTMPRLFTPGDIIDIPVTVFAMKENVKDVEVTLKTDPLVEIIGTASQSARFTEIGEPIIFFKIKTRENTGRSTL
ncbi:MAG: alpha-2-macroglobulin, partial [Odoribacteraceae bacterium]|nr:alpha-2-macroglobulin [Odoribacteraceae bacterium]